MKVEYNVTYKFKTDKTKTKDEKRYLFNEKLLKVILSLENDEKLLNIG